jgi:hypothetical protein
MVMVFRFWRYLVMAGSQYSGLLRLWRRVIGGIMPGALVPAGLPINGLIYQAASLTAPA